MESKDPTSRQAFEMAWHIPPCLPLPCLALPCPASQALPQKLQCKPLTSITSPNQSLRQSPAFRCCCARENKTRETSLASENSTLFLCSFTPFADKYKPCLLLLSRMGISYHAWLAHFPISCRCSSSLTTSPHISPPEVIVIRFDVYGRNRQTRRTINLLRHPFVHMVSPLWTGIPQTSYVVLVDPHNVASSFGRSAHFAFCPGSKKA